MATEYGYLELDGVVHGPLSRTETQTAVAEQPAGEWRHAPHGLEFDDLPDWAREAPDADVPTLTSLPLPVSRRWPGTDAWFKRVTYIGAVAVLIGFFLPTISSAGPLQVELLWDRVANVEWTLFAVFAFSIVFALGVVVPILVLRGPPGRRRAIYVLLAASAAFWIHAESPHPTKAYGHVFHGALATPPRDVEPTTDESDPPWATVSRVNPDRSWLLTALLLAGCVLIFAGTRAESRYLGHGPPWMTRAGGWLVIAAFILPSAGNTLLEYLYYDTVGEGRPVITTVLASAVLLLGLLATLAGWRPSDLRLGCQLRRWMLYVIGLGTPLVVYGVLAAHRGPSLSLATVVLRDTLVGYGLLILIGASLSAWMSDRIPNQRRPIPPGAFIPGSIHRRQGTFALGLLILAIAPAPRFVFDEFTGARWEAQWWIERVVECFQGKMLDGVDVAQRLDLLLWIVVLPGLLYLASRLRDRRMAVALGLTAIAVTAWRPMAGTGGGFSVAGVWAIHLSADPNDWRGITGFARVGIPLGVGLSLICGALHVARDNPRAPGISTALRVGGLLLAIPLLVTPLAGSVSGVQLAMAFTAPRAWAFALIALGLAALGVLGLLEPRNLAARDRRRQFLSRLLLPALVAAAILYVVGGVAAGGPSDMSTTLRWLSSIREAIGLTLMTLLLALWTAEAIRLFAADPALRQQRVFE